LFQFCLLLSVIGFSLTKQSFRNFIALTFGTDSIQFFHKSFEIKVFLFPKTIMARFARVKRTFIRCSLTKNPISFSSFDQTREMRITSFITPISPLENIFK
jgi:hypothetical protein